MRHSLVEFVGKRWSLFQAQNFVALTLAQKRKSSRCATMFIRCHDKLSSIEEKTKKCGRLNLARHWCICWTNQNETLKGPSQLHFISSITPLFSHFFCFHTELKKSVSLPRKNYVSKNYAPTIQFKISTDCTIKTSFLKKILYIFLHNKTSLCWHFQEWHLDNNFFVVYETKFNELSRVKFVEVIMKNYKQRFFSPLPSILLLSISFLCQILKSWQRLKCTCFQLGSKILVSHVSKEIQRILFTVELKKVACL